MVSIFFLQLSVSKHTNAHHLEEKKWIFHVVLSQNTFKLGGYLFFSANCWPNKTLVTKDVSILASLEYLAK